MAGTKELQERLLQAGQVGNVGEEKGTGRTGAGDEAGLGLPQ